ncbi:hypothetical protein B0T11DRAFT_324596 [Plectosphaerella cucumerina]|uniref:FAD-binding domain-containing protein n=1 Tax=Plectosphaerella cucumerina TaxID=40658 RepID=A0A8K0TU35_9PEZI|nr:hypothetical protein B0T11DRAFT_324596 [Plectosphaerella cucumerina]
MRVLINGAGVAGNALAFWLGKLGHDVTVVERFPRLRVSGLQIDLRGFGIDVVRRMGLEAQLRAKLAPEQGAQFVDSSGKRWGYFPANPEAPVSKSKAKKNIQNFTSEYEIMRGDLCQVLYEAARERVKYIFDTRVASFENKNESVRVSLSNGTSDDFDLLVGADGQGSSIRNMMFEPEVTKAAYRPLNDMHMAYVTVPRPMTEGEEYVATAFIAPGRRGLMTRRDNPDTVQVYMGCTSTSERLKRAISRPRGERGTDHEILGEQLKAWQEIFDGAGWQTADIFRSLLDTHNAQGTAGGTPDTLDMGFYTERPALVKLDSWSRGRVTLLGDAAWCPTATTGMGTTSAIVGAYVLAGEIQKACPTDGAVPSETLADALTAYQRVFGPFMDDVQKDVLKGSDPISMFPTSTFGIAVFLRVVWVVSLLRINIGRWFLKEEIMGWELPEYKKL